MRASCCARSRAAKGATSSSAIRLINFDVPWNPMAIEQRIGRIDRIGQSREVFVFNLVTRGTLEEQLLALLDEKISMFELVVGEVGAILGGLEEEREFPDLVLDAWLGATEAARVQAFDALGQRLEQARRSTRAPRRSTRSCSARISRRREDEPWEPCAISSPTCWRARARSSSRWSRTGSKCWRRSPCAPPWAGRNLRGWDLAPRCLPARMPIGLEGDWLDRFGALLGERGRLAERQLVVADKVAAPSDPERLLDRALDLPNAVWRLHDAKPAWTSCLLLAFRYTAMSDERREGLVWLGFNQGTGAVIDGDMLARLRKLLAGEVDWHAPEPDTRRAAGAAWDAAALAARVRPLVEHHVRRDLEPFLNAMRRRLDRDRGRIHEYHDDLRRTAQMKLAALAVGVRRQGGGRPQARDPAGRRHRARICRQAR